MSRTSQVVGAAFEGWINTQHEKAKLLGILAHVEKTEAHAKIVNGRLIYTERGVADYIGTMEGGRSLVVEAKSTGEERLYRDAVTKKQQEHLEAVARAGGLALLLVEFRGVPPVQMRFAIPWLEVMWQVSRTAESVRMINVSPWLVSGDCYLSSWHAGGLRSGAHLDRKRKFARE